MDEGRKRVIGIIAGIILSRNLGHTQPSSRSFEWLRDARYEGIRFPSALHPQGTNVIFFDPAFADVGASKLVKIIDTSLEYEQEELDPLALENRRCGRGTARLVRVNKTGAN